MTFEELNLIPPILKALTAQGYENPTPIQEQSIGVVLEGKDLLGTAQTGTGKTAAFALPILQLLYKSNPAPKGHRLRALVLSPTRELAIQIRDSFVSYGRFLGIKSTVVYGGVSQVPQVSAIRSGVDILIATPGRLLDLMNQKLINLSDVRYFVLDEADHMLDMGFIIDVKKIIADMPTERQTLMFSATMPQEILSLAGSILKVPARVAIDPVTSTVDSTAQFMYFVEKHNKKNLLIHLLKNEQIESALVFSRTKHGADKIVEDLKRVGIEAEAIHGNKSQSARQMALKNFKAKKTKILIATDIAARGIDVVELSHVINYDLPNVPETYVHRIGRTGRAGLSGIALSFCDEEEVGCLRDIQKFTGQKIPVVTEQPYAADFAALVAPKKPDFNRFRAPSARGAKPRAHTAYGAGRNFHSKKFSPTGSKPYSRKPQD